VDDTITYLRKEECKDHPIRMSIIEEAIIEKDKDKNANDNN